MEKSSPAAEKPVPADKVAGPEAVEVKVLDQPLHAEGSAIEGLLFDTFATGMGEAANLGHIRIFVFDQKTLKQVGFATCG